MEKGSALMKKPRLYVEVHWGHDGSVEEGDVNDPWHSVVKRAPTAKQMKRLAAAMDKELAAMDLLKEKGPGR